MVKYALYGSMPLIKYTQDTYRSVVQPPAGYRLIRTELLRAGDGPTRDEEEVYRELNWELPDFPDNWMLFRCIVETPNGKLYSNSVVESLVDLCKREFWEDFWQAVQSAAEK
jgi:hypothetical protein